MKFRTVYETSPDGQRVLSVPAEFEPEDVRRILLDPCPALPEGLPLSRATEVARSLRSYGFAELGTAHWRVQPETDWYRLGIRLFVAAFFITLLVYYFTTGGSGYGSDSPYLGSLRRGPFEGIVTEAIA